MPKSLLQSSRLLFISVVALAVFIPLYPKFPLIGVAKTFVAVRLEDLFIAGVSVYFVWQVFKRGLVKKLLHDSVVLAILVFWLIGFFSVVSAVIITQTVSFHLAILHLLRRVEMMMLLPITMLAISNQRRLWTFFITLSGVVFVADVYALGQQYVGWPVVSTTNSEFAKGLILYLTAGARVNSTFAGHYDLATFLVMFFSILAAVIFTFKGWVNKIYLVLLGGMSAYVLMLSAARQSFVAAILGISFACWFSGKKIFIVVIVLVSIAAMASPSPLRDRLESTIVVSLGLDTQRYVSNIPEQNRRSIVNIPTLQGPAIKLPPESTLSGTTEARFASDITPGEPTDQTELEVYRSIGIRLNIEWPRAIRAFLKNPFLGTGYSSTGIATDNDVLRSLAEVGLLGTIAFGLVIFAIIKKLLRIGASDPDKRMRLLSVGILAAIFAFFVNSLFIDVFEASKVASLFWMIIGATLAAADFVKGDSDESN